jgi:hypothetical protein
MELLSRALAAAPDDPVLLAGAVLLAWLPVCAAGLGSLALLAAVQYHLAARRKRHPALIVPPAELRPLVTRRLITAGPRGAGLVGAARLGLAIGAVLAFTALVLASSGQQLFAALRN